MSEPDPVHERERIHRVSGVLVFMAAAVLVVGVILVVLRYPRQAGIAQPLPFSHRVHAGQKKIGCLFCHEGAMMTATAGIPPLRRCMHCHSRIAMGFAPIRKLREYYEDGRPIPWKRVNKLADFVYFNHSVHIFRSVDCSRCHGDVRAMDRVIQPHTMHMGFCVQCHRDHGATHDCFTCHR